MRPWAAAFPLRRTATRSQVSSISERRCEFSRIARPRDASSRRRSRISRRPTGSTPSPVSSRKDFASRSASRSKTLEKPRGRQTRSRPGGLPVPCTDPTISTPANRHSSWRYVPGQGHPSAWRSWISRPANSPPLSMRVGTALRALDDELAVLRPREIVAPRSDVEGRSTTAICRRSTSQSLAVTPIDSWAFELESARRSLLEQSGPAVLKGSASTAIPPPWPPQAAWSTTSGQPESRSRPTCDRSPIVSVPTRCSSIRPR